MKQHNYVNKKFNTILPLVKAETGEDGYYYLTFGLSTDTADLENEQVTEACLDDMIEQAKSINSFQVHQYGLDDIIGPIVDAWKEKQNKTNIMFVNVRVRPSLTEKIKELVDTGVRLGGSIGGIYLKDRMQDGIRILEKVQLLEGSLTPLPVNWDTLGTAGRATKSCPNGLCKQIYNSIHGKYFKAPKGQEDMTVTKSRSESDSYEGLRDKVDAAVRAAYTQDGLGTWIKLTFPDSVIVEDHNENKFYEIPYTINGDGEVELGERTEVEEQYVEKKYEIFRSNFLEDYNMDKKEFETFKTEMITAQKEQNDALIGAIKGLVPEAHEEPPADPAAGAVKTVDEESIVDKTVAGVLKALGVQVPEDETETEQGSVVILNDKALEDLQADIITKTILEVAKQRKGTRKSNPLGGNKFEAPTVPEEKGGNGKMSTRKAAEALARRKGLIVSA